MESKPRGKQKYATGIPSREPVERVGGNTRGSDPEGHESESDFPEEGKKGRGDDRKEHQGQGGFSCPRQGAHW